MREKIVKQYLKNNPYLNILLALSLFIVITFPFCYKYLTTNYLFYYDFEYYYGLLRDLSLGYIISLLFYILVVFWPETKKKNLIKTKTNILFARLSTSLGKYIIATLAAFNIEIDENDDIIQKSKSILEENRDKIYLKLSREIDKADIELKFEKNYSTYLDIITDNSSRIEKLTNDLIPFLPFLDKSELELYTEIEDILIFEYIPNLENEFGVYSLFVDEFQYIIKAYFNLREMVTGRKIKIFYNKNG